MRHFEAAVIGGGVVGCAILRALTLAGLRSILLERGPDILSGASKGNSAILHTGFDAPTGSLEQRLMQTGRQLYLAIRERLGLPLLETDAILVAWTADEVERLEPIRRQAEENGVTGVRRLSEAELRRRLPDLDRTALATLEIPGEHIVDPWSAPLAYALQAIANGAVIERLAEVVGARREAGRWRLETRRGPLTADLVVNSAGVFGDHVEALCRAPSFAIRPRKGQFVVFDKTARRLVPSIILPVPSERTKGIVVCPTAFGNVLVGPTAEEQEDRERAEVDQATLARLLSEAGRLVPALAAEPIVAAYAGLRPATAQKDYILECDATLAWITVAGIRSTGLTAALGIAEAVVERIGSDLRALSPLVDPAWPQVPNLAEHRPRDHQRPGRGDLVCLCELVTRDEVEAALSGPLPAGDLGGLKRRTRATMGRCQGFHCLATLCALAQGRLLAPPFSVAASHGR